MADKADHIPALHPHDHLADIAKISEIYEAYTNSNQEPKQEKCVSQYYRSPFPAIGSVCDVKWGLKQIKHLSHPSVLH